MRRRYSMLNTATEKISKRRNSSANAKPTDSTDSSRTAATFARIRTTRQKSTIRLKLRTSGLRSSS